jgi:hypothetical protein
MRSNIPMNCSYCETERRERPRELRGPTVRLQDHVHHSGLADREDGRPDLPVIGPEDSPRRIARRLV